MLIYLEMKDAFKFQIDFLMVLNVNVMSKLRVVD